MIILSIEDYCQNCPEFEAEMIFARQIYSARIEKNADGFKNTFLEYGRKRPKISHGCLYRNLVEINIHGFWRDALLEMTRMKNWLPGWWKWEKMVDGTIFMGIYYLMTCMIFDISFRCLN